MLRDGSSTFVSQGSKNGHGFATKAVHSGFNATLYIFDNGMTIVIIIGCEMNEDTGSIIPSITLSTVFNQKSPGIKPGQGDPNSYGKGFFYSRQGNPSRGALERTLADLENGKFCCVFSSGMAAISSVIQSIASGGEVLALDELYGKSNIILFIIKY